MNPSSSKASVEPQLWRDGESWRGIFPGALPAKANSRQIARYGAKVRVIKSKAALAWDKAFVFTMGLLWGKRDPLEGLLELFVTVWQPDRRRDLEVELLKDSLQRSGIVRNDRRFVHVDAWIKLDRLAPRVEFEIRPLRGDSHA